jgi:hypothetical protein
MVSAQTVFLSSHISTYTYTRIANKLAQREKVMVYVLVEFEVSRAVTRKNIVFWNIKTPFIPHRKHITSLLQSPAG